MIGLKLRDEFLCEHMTGTAITLRTSDNQGAAQKSAEDILSITYPMADVQIALKAVSSRRSGRPIVRINCGRSAQRNLDAVRSTGVTVPHARELISAIWMRSLSPGKVKGGSPRALHLDITRTTAEAD
jgi:hypothetical protein